MQYDGYLSTYSIMKDGHKVTLKPLHPDELAKRHKVVQDTLMTRSEIIWHIDKEESVLIVVSIEEPNEEGHMSLDLSVEKIFHKIDDVIAEDVPLELPDRVIVEYNLTASIQVEQVI